MVIKKKLFLLLWTRIATVKSVTEMHFILIFLEFYVRFQFNVFLNYKNLQWLKRKKNHLNWRTLTCYLTADKYRNPYPCWLAKSNVSYNMGANSGCGILGLFAAVCVSLNAFINFWRKKYMYLVITWTHYKNYLHNGIMFFWKL